MIYHDLSVRSLNSHNINEHLCIYIHLYRLRMAFDAQIISYRNGASALYQAGPHLCLDVSVFCYFYVYAF